MTLQPLVSSVLNTHNINKLWLLKGVYWLWLDKDFKYMMKLQRQTSTTTMKSDRLYFFFSFISCFALRSNTCIWQSSEVSGSLERHIQRKCIWRQFECLVSNCSLNPYPCLFWQTGTLSILSNLTSSRCQGRKHSWLPAKHWFQLLVGW